MSLASGTKLYYINKFNSNLEEATVDEVFDGGFSVSFYTDSVLRFARLRNETLNTQLFESKQQAWTAWYQRHPKPTTPSGSDIYFDDITITCQECGKQFIWTASDREYYRKQSLNPPKRCPDCRKRLRNMNNGRGLYYPTTSNESYLSDWERERQDWQNENNEYANDVMESYARSDDDGWYYSD